MYEEIARRLAARQPVILDGGTGTEIQRKGIIMDEQNWCASANLEHGEVVRDVHRDYIRAGADVITANTYASSPLSFSSLGRETDIGPIDRAAVRLAREAIEQCGDSSVLVAGSCSVMPPVIPGTARGAQTEWDPGKIKPLYRKKTEVLADAGCDLIIMEMMRDLNVSLWATEAAVATGLPVWVGMSVERDDEGELVSFGNRRWPLKELASGLLDTGADAALVMHNEISTTSDALAIIGSVWNGPLGAYPEAGHFEMPTWVFRDISPAEFADAAQQWRRRGALILGGCCGITPEHIRALAASVKDPANPA